MQLISVSFKVPARRAYLQVLLEALVMLDRLWLRERARVEGVGAARTNLYDQGVVYQREERDPNTGLRREEFRTYPELVKWGVGDCEDLAAARVAELRESGINARPWLTRIGRMWHVQVRHPNGTIEDPSAKLGMKGRA